ncbi:MAG: prepilin-type N-terminal cleavage/methylation domain-containing protein [bacterium]
MIFYINKKQRSERKGFTLAEVLSTLAVVGVLAAISMGIILPKIQDAQHKTAFVAIYSELTQVTTKIMMDNGGSLKGVFTNANIRDKFAQYLNIIKSCNYGQILGNCWHNNDGSSKYLNGTPKTNWGNYSGVILNNGVLFSFYTSNSNCTNSSGSILFCGFITVDVNGFRGPNTIGKDIYFIWIQENGIKPWGTKGDTLENTCTTSNTGWGCAAKVLMGQDY